MYIKSVEIQDIRCFDKISLEFQVCRNKDSDPLLNWNVILGNNGDGKTTLLQAIAACLMDVTTAQFLWDPDDRKVVRTEKTQEKTHGKLQAIIVREENDSQPVGAPLKRKDTNELLVDYVVMQAGQTIDISKYSSVETRSFPKSVILEPVLELSDYFGDTSVLAADIEYLKRTAFSKREGKGWVSCGYGPFRRINGFSSEAAKANDMLERRFYTLFDEGAALYKCEAWLKELDRKAAREGKDVRSKPSSHTKTLNQVIDLIKKILPGITSIAIEDKVQFHREKEVFNLNELSDGYRSMFALAIDLMSWLELLRKDKTKEINLTSGVVLIDEIDAHLHPRWQREIGFQLTGNFPNIQFIVTTHSPFVAMAAGKGALTILERGENGAVIANQDVPFARGWAVDKVLSELLGMDSLRDPETEDMLEKYDELKIISLQRTLKQGELEQFDDLRSTLEERLENSGQTLNERNLDAALKYIAALANKKA